MLHTKFRFIWPSGVRGQDFVQKLTNQKQELPVAAMFVNGAKRNGAILIEDLPQMLPTKSRFIWPSCFRGEVFQKCANQKQELPVAVTFSNGSGRNEQSLYRTFHRCFIPSFSLFGQAILDEKIFQKSTNKKQELTLAAMFVNGSGRCQPSAQRTFHRCLKRFQFIWLSGFRGED